MADISRIKLSDGEVYEVKDSEARYQLELLLGKPDVENDDEASDAE